VIADRLTCPIARLRTDHELYGIGGQMGARSRSRSVPPVPTLGQIHRGTPWLWLNCPACRHHRPVAIAPFVIRWGSEVSSDVLRRSARCSLCGHKGATLTHPSWAGLQVGFAPFPR